MKPQRLFAAAAGTAVWLLAALPALSWAQVAPVLPFGSLTYTAPTGTVNNTAVIDINVRFTLDLSSPALNFSNNPLTGIDLGLAPTQGVYYPTMGNPELRDFASIHAAQLNVYAGCSGSFIGDCTPGSTDYTFDFHFGAGSMVGLQAINLAPGDFVDYKLGTFTPKPGGAAPGVYSFTNTGLTLEFIGLDADGNTLFSNGLTLATECMGCDFSRTVVATPVPEPGSTALMLAGLVVLRGLHGARKRHATA